MTKVITNCLKQVLPSIISKDQSAFTPEYFITDNILVAFEIFHSMNGHVGANGFMALKLDSLKAYDKVEWIFLRNMMLQLGFRPCWVNLIMSFVEITTYSFVVNGEPYGFVTPARGTRQGDPISLYLFLFCAEVLSALLDAVGDGSIHGYRICQLAHVISHLLFADDTIIFCKANMDEARTI